MSELSCPSLVMILLPVDEPTSSRHVARGVEELEQVVAEALLVRIGDAVRGAARISCYRASPTLRPHGPPWRRVDRRLLLRQHDREERAASVEPLKAGGEASER